MTVSGSFEQVRKIGERSSIMRSYECLTDSLGGGKSAFAGRVAFAILIIVMLGLTVPAAHAQTPGFLGYVLNSTQGTVTVFASESDAIIGNNDHAIATVTVGSNPQQIAVTPDGLFAFVSSPGDSSVWQIDMTNPMSPIPSKITTFSNLGTPGGIAITTFTNAAGTITYYLVWVADSKNCVMHVLNSQLGYSDTPEQLAPPSGSSGTASCGSSIDFPAVVATPDQTTAVFAAFDQVQFTDSTTAPPTVTPAAPYIFAFSPASTTNSALVFSGFTLQAPTTLNAMQDSSSVPGNILLFIGEGSGTLCNGCGAVDVLGISPTTLTQFGPQQQIISLAEITPTAIATNNLDGLQGISDSRTDVSFYLFVGENGGDVGVYSIDCGSSASPSTSCTSSLAVSFTTTLTVGGIPLSLAAVPSSFKGDGRASIIYATETGANRIQLILGEGPTGFPTPCVVGTTACTGVTVAGGQVYDTAVTVGKVPTGATFGPISTTSSVITWFTGYSLTGGGPFTPFASPGTGLPTFYPPPGTLYSDIVVQVLGMVSTLSGGYSWIGTTTAEAASGFTSSATCNGLGGSACPSPEGPGVQTSTVALAPTVAPAAPAIALTGVGVVAQQTGSSPTVQSGDVTTIIFGGTNQSSIDKQCGTSPPNPACSYAQIQAKTQATCTLEVSVDGSLPSRQSPIEVIAGFDPVTGYLSCLGSPADTISGDIDWGDGSPSTPDQSPITTVDGGATPPNPLPSSSKTSAYATVGARNTISFAVSDISADPNYVVTASANTVIAIVVAPLSITTTSLPTGTQGMLYTTTLAAIGGTDNYSWSPSTASPLPSWLILTSSGQLTGTPTTSGTYTFKVQVQDTGAANPQTATSMSLTVTVNGPSGGPLTISTTALPAGTQGVLYGPESLVASGGTPPYTWSITTGALPPGLNLSSSNGQISGTPLATDSGAYNFTVQVADSSSTQQKKTQSLSINVAPPLIITTTSLPGGTAGQVYGPVTLSASGGNQPYIWSVITGALPPGLSLSSSNGQISGTPSTTDTGSYNFIVQVTDSNSTVQTSTLSILIAAGLTNPSITPACLGGSCVNQSTASVGPGQSAKFTLTFDGNSAEAGAVFVIACQGLPQGSSCSYSPNPFGLNSNGINSVTLTITTTGPGSTASLPSNDLWRFPVFALLLSLTGLFGLLLTGLLSHSPVPQRRAYLFSLVLLLCTVCALLSACNTTVSQSNLPCPGCTPSGTSTVQVVATSQHPALQSSVNLQLQVSGQ
jgi:hypothetical protein